MKSAIAIVYTGPHEEVRQLVGEREFLVKRNGQPLKVDQSVALELIGRSSPSHGWKCADLADQKDVDNHFAEAAKKAAEAAKKPEAPKKPTESVDPKAPIDATATAPKQ
jgi:hypothetical protein